MEIRDYLRLLRRNWILIVALSLVGLIAGGTASLLARPTYTSVTQLFVAIQSSGSVTELQQGNTFSQARVQSYVKTVTTPSVLDPVISRLGLQTTSSALAQNIKASTDLNTVLINISVTDASPAQSAAIAAAVADSLVKAVDDLEKPRTGGASPVRLSIVTPATTPESPTSPNTKLNLLIGLIVGLLAGLGSAVLRTKLDNRVRGEMDVRHVTEKPVLGGISFDSGAVKKPLVTQSEVLSPRAESFRQLRTNLQFAHISHKSKTVLITSSVPGEGKSTTATNLAISMAQSGKTVVLVDADLRRPMIGEYLGLDRSVGLTTALIGQADVGDLLQPWGDDDLYVLTSGQIPPNPSELLGSGEMRDLLAQLEETFDAVIVDAPPLLPVTDSAVLSQLVDGVVVVVGMLGVRQTELEKSLAALQMVEANVLGLVLNRIPAKGPDAYAYGGYYTYDSRPGKQNSEKIAARPQTAGKRISSAAKESDGEFFDQESDFDTLLVTPSERGQRRYRAN
ncbi:polysaccharide biosynthesis tyrosine autokinase [bacterium RCC_150]